MRRTKQKTVWPKNFRPNFFSIVFFFSLGGLGGRSRPNHFKKFAKANFLKWCRGGVWGGLPPSGISVTRALPPGEGLGGFAPSGISVIITRALPPQRPCLAPVPCPQFFFVGIFSSEFFRLNFFRPSSVRPCVRPSVVRPSDPDPLRTRTPH